MPIFTKELLKVALGIKAQEEREVWLQCVHFVLLENPAERVEGGRRLQEKLTAWLALVDKKATP